MHEFHIIYFNTTYFVLFNWIIIVTFCFINIILQNKNKMFNFKNKILY